MREIDKRVEEYNGVRGDQFEKVKNALKMKVHSENTIEAEEEEKDRQ